MRYLVLILAVMFSVIFLSMLRFQITNPVGEVAVAYRLDRLTGKVYMLGLGKEIAVKRVPSDSIQGWEIKSF